MIPVLGRGQPGEPNTPRRARPTSASYESGRGRVAPAAVVLALFPRGSARVLPRSAEAEERPGARPPSARIDRDSEFRHVSLSPNCGAIKSAPAAPTAIQAACFGHL